MAFILLHGKSGGDWYVETSHIAALHDQGEFTDIYLTGDRVPLTVQGRVEDILKRIFYEDE